MARMPIFFIMVLLASGSGCAAWKYRDEAKPVMQSNDEVPATGRPWVMSELQGLSNRIDK